MSESAIATNRQARRDYLIGDTWEAGIELKGTEVKSIRAGKINLRGAFAQIHRDEVWMHDCDIQPWESASHEQHESKRPRKLLLHRREIERLIGAVEQKGLTLIPLSLYFSRGRAKVKLALGRGKKQYDKREDLKRRDAERDVARALNWKGRQ